MTRRRAPLGVAVVAVALVAALLGCSNDGRDGVAETGTTPATEAPSSTEATTTVGGAAEPLRILVTNDDGVSAPGIDTVVEALRALDDVEVVVVAPLDNQSATGANTTDGEVAVADATTASGYEATSVDGFPADAVNVAIEDLGIEPHLVVSGVNKGQNIGALVDVSGTVGAARAAVLAGVPALAVSTGHGSDGIAGPDSSFDFAAAVPFVVDWVVEHRDALIAGTAPVEVANLNVPTCESGEVRGLHEAPVDYESAPLTVQDCTSTAAPSDSDVQAFATGWAVLTQPLPEAPPG